MHSVKPDESLGEKTQPILILGSARSDGNTKRLIKVMDKEARIPLVDLNDLRIDPFDYTHENQSDDYLPLMERIVANYDPLILATPVYWYTMSAQMKIFIDRLSDLLTIRKDLGRGLAGKTLLVLACYGSSFPEGFDFPFSQTCDYMKMRYGGSFLYDIRCRADDPDFLGGIERIREKITFIHLNTR